MSDSAINNGRGRVSSYQKILILITAIPSFAVSYYFLFELPRHNKELQRRADLKKLLEESERTRKSVEFDVCKENAESKYWSYVELNAISKKKGKQNEDIFTAPNHIWEHAENIKRSDMRECELDFKLH